MTRTPKPQAYAHAAPARLGTFHGSLTTLKVKRGGKLTYTVGRVDLDCGDAGDDFDITDSTSEGSVRIKHGTFTHTTAFKGGGASGTLTVVGALSARKARGAVVANGTVGQDLCTSGKLGWSARA